MTDPRVDRARERLADDGWVLEFPMPSPNLALLADLLAAYDELAASVRAREAAAWAEGHIHPHRRGPDDCHCGAWSSNEFAYGEYGTGELLSLADNPYREGGSDD